MEHQYTRTLQTLRHDTQPREYDDLFTVSEALIAHAALQPVLFDTEQPSKLELFNDKPDITQAIWKGNETTGRYRQDILGVSFLRDALIIGLHSRNASELTRNIVIGPSYARYSQHLDTRPAIQERWLDSEQVTEFTAHFDSFVARMGLSHVIQTAREHQIHTAEDQAA